MKGIVKFMRKSNTQINSNSHTTNGQNTNESPSFSMNNKETYLKLINILKGLTVLKKYSPMLDITHLASQLLDKNERLYEEYYNKYIQSIYEINEGYNFFESSIASLIAEFSVGSFSSGSCFFASASAKSGSLEISSI